MTIETIIQFIIQVEQHILGFSVSFYMNYILVRKNVCD
jgi:hypothetical protein